MRCFVTTGPSFEPLDQVRRLTNFSTGRSGTVLAQALVDASHEVTLLRGIHSTHPLPDSFSGSVETFTTTADLAARILRFATEDPVAFFHVAAVSDFSFGLVYERQPNGQFNPVYGNKLDSSFESLWVELKPTPKILSSLREWFPNARLAGWKYEVQGTQEEVLQRASTQIMHSRTDLCIANGPAYGDGYGWVCPTSGHVMIPDQAALVERLVQWTDGASPE